MGVLSFGYWILDPGFEIKVKTKPGGPAALPAPNGDIA
jgi:hypothetical protein